MFDNNRLKQRRLDMGLTLEEVGKVAGISRSAVQKYEKGVIKNVYTSIVEDFSRALHCSPAYLMGWTDEPRLEKISENEFSLTEHEKKLVSAYRNKPDMQNSVDKLLDIEQGDTISNDISRTVQEISVALSSKKI